MFDYRTALSWLRRQITSLVKASGLWIAILLVSSVSIFAGQYFYGNSEQAAQMTASGHPAGTCLTAEEAELARIINNYRNNSGLSSIPVTRSLSKVAQMHVVDLHHNRPDENRSDYRGYSCNMHSWSANSGANAVCYTPDHIYAAQMWNKPREVTNNAYDGYGFEIAYKTYAQATAGESLRAWQASPGHNPLIVQQGYWSTYNWPAMGVGIYEGYAVVWFGSEPDPHGNIPQCP